MKITNKYNLPEALVNFISESRYKHTEKHYSVTTILNPTRSIMLNRRHFDEIEIDASSCVNQLLGTATHSLLEKFDKTGNAEIYLKEEIINGYYLTGRCDLYNENDFALEDYKTATVWKVKFGDFDDWRLQGLMYAWLFRKSKRYVGKLKFHAILKDWTARDLRLAKLKGEWYPESPIWSWIYDNISESDMKEIENFIFNKFIEIRKAEKLQDDELDDCGKADTWYTGDKYAVYKDEKATKAVRVFEEEQEAKDYIENKMNGKGIIIFRPGEYRRCQDYCECCNFCKYYQERKKGE